MVLLSWSALVPKSQPIVNKEVVTKSEPSDSFSTIPVGTEKKLTVNEPDLSNTEEKLVFSQENRDIVFDVNKADIVEVIFKKSLEHKLSLKNGFLSEGKILFKRGIVTKDQITFVHEGKDLRVVKKFYIPKDSYTIGLEITTQNLSSHPIELYSHVVLGKLDLSSSNPQVRYQDVFLGGREKTSHLSASKNFNENNIKFIGLRDQYFCAIIEPDNSNNNAYIKKINNQESEVGITGQEVELSPGKQIGHSYRIYLGPQKLKVINDINSEWAGIIYFGVFDFIAQLILQLLGLFYALVHNWGWAIIILSFAVYFLLFPLMLKQMRSMKEMQALQPKIEALRKEFKDNPQRLNKEMMELYKEHKVNPLGGCLPLLLQMPIFFALYQALMRSVDLRGASFLWIKDLSSPDQLFTFKTSLPFIGDQFNLLPILMAIGMFVQQKVSSVKVTGEAAQQQKIMSIVMPVMFGVIFYRMPSGLVLYWFVNSTLMLLYQISMNRQK